MTNTLLTTDLFALGQKHFSQFKAEFASYGLEADPALELKQGSGLLCYYDLEERQIYLSTPDFSQPTGKLQALFFRSLLGCKDNEELMRFFELFIPHIIAHEMAHHYRHRYGLFGDSLWEEEQVANKLAVAVVKHRLSPVQKTQAKQFLRQAIEALAAKMEEKNIAVDSHYSVLHALNVSGQIQVADFENIEMMQTAFGVSAETLLEGSGQISPEMVERLEDRDELIRSIDEQYTADQIKYIFYHVGWLYIDLNSRETEYVDEFARNYLGLSPALLPMPPEQQSITPQAVQACYQAHQSSGSEWPVLRRYFYKRYRALLLALLETSQLDQAAQGQRMKREIKLLLENWQAEETDTLDYLAQLAPVALRPLFPHRIAQNLDPTLQTPDHLPTETDRRLWQYGPGGDQTDEAAANTLYRLEILDQTDIYRALPARPLLELAEKFNQVRFAAGEPVIWENERNDDVYFLIEGQLEVLITREGQPQPIAEINPGQMFGEIAFFTEDPRMATVRAVVPSRCFVLTDVDLQLLAYRHPTILMQMAGVLAQRLTTLYETGRHEAV